MSVQDLTNAIISGINDGGEKLLEGSLAGTLPIIWLIILGLHLARPYVLDMIDRFTLRLGADLLWLLYVAARDLLIVAGVVMSFMFFFPDVVKSDELQLPITGGLTAAVLFAVLLVKLMGDPDHNLRDFRLVTALLGIGAALYLIPYVLGVQLQGMAGPFQGISNFLVTSSNPDVAVVLAYVSIGLLAIMGAVAAFYTLRTGGRAEAPESVEASGK